MKMTYVDALNLAISAMDYKAKCEDEAEAAQYVACSEKLTAMKEQLMKRGTTSDKAKEARKAKTAEARSELVKTVTPVLRKALTTAPEGMTAKELFTACEKELPEGFTAAKVQNVLLREMAPELEKIEDKRKANVYRLIKG